MAAVAPLYSADEYEDLVRRGVLGPGDHIELLLGVIIEVSPQGPRHAAVLMLCAEAVQVALAGRAAIRTQMPFRAGPYSMPEPDLAVVPGRTADYLDAHPTTALLVAEIAGSSLVQDRMTKAAVYAEAGVPEYWIVDLASDTVVVHTEPAGRRYRHQQTLRRGDSITLVAVPGAAVAVDDLLGPV